MIGYYAHYHGYGHSNYANELQKELANKMLIFSNSDFKFDFPNKVVFMEDEEEDSNYDENLFPTPCHLHRAPMNVQKITSRCATLLNTVLEKNIQLLIVDVNVEIAALARVCSIPFVYRRMFGKRNDTPHLYAYKEACFLVAYYPKELESDDTPTWVRKKTFYTGFISKAKFSGKYYNPINEPFVLVMKGKGGSRIDANFISKLKFAFSDIKLIVLGEIDDSEFVDDNINYLGFVSNVIPYIDHAAYIISSCGSNSTSEILSRKRKFLIVPEERPFDEQKEICNLLEKNHLGVSLDIDNITSSVAELENLSEGIAEKYVPGNFSDFAAFLKENDFNALKIMKSILQEYSNNRVLAS